MIDKHTLKDYVFKENVATMFGKLAEIGAEDREPIEVLNDTPTDIDDASSSAGLKIE